MQCSSILLQGVLIKKEKSKIFVYGDKGLSLERILTVINKKSMDLVSWQCLLDIVKHFVDQLNSETLSSCNKDVISWHTSETQTEKLFLEEVGRCWWGKKCKFVGQMKASHLSFS